MIDRIICLIGLALAAVYFYATAQIPSLEIGDPLGPKAFPILLGTVLLIAIVMIVAIIAPLLSPRLALAESPAPSAISSPVSRHFM